MAKRKSKRSYNKMSKIQPAEQTMFFRLAVPPTGSTINYIDLSQCASLINRRFYRQGINWAVSGFKLVSDSPANGRVQISKLPNTWVMSNAWEKSFRTWQEMNDKALDDAESVSGRFLDFKIYANANHHQNGFANNLLPRDSAANLAAIGEWIPSEVRIPNTFLPGTTVAYEIIAVGDNYPGVSPVTTKDAVSCIQGYANSRGLPSISDPNTPTLVADAVGNTPENWMTGISNEGLDQDSGVLNDVRAYDQPPYPYENDGVNVVTMYPGGADNMEALVSHDEDRITGTTIGGTSYLKGGNFPCGLIELAITNDTASEVFYSLYVDLVPGNHRGYLCEPMTEM